MRVVSLAPNISHILSALDVTPVATTAHTEVSQTSVGTWLQPDYDAVANLDADIVFTSDALQDHVVEKVGDLDASLHHYEPRRLDDLFSMIADIGRIVDADERAATLNEELQNRRAAVKEYVSDRSRPVVYAEEWDKPPMAAGNWVPDMIRVAGGSYPFVSPGERSQEISMETYQEVYKNESIDVFVSHLCGCGVQNSFRDIRDSWPLPDEVYFVHERYMNQLSPNTIIGIEILATLLHEHDEVALPEDAYRRYEHNN